MAKLVRVMTRPAGIETEDGLDAFLDALGIEPEADPKQAKASKEQDAKKTGVKRTGKNKKAT